MRTPDPRPVRTAGRALAAGARHVRDTVPLRQMTIAGAAVAAPLVRRAGEGPVAGLGMIVISLGTTLQASGSLAVVLACLVLFGVGVPPVLVALITLLEHSTPAALQGRVYSAVEVLVGVPQMISIAAGALLVTLVDYRLLLLLEATVVAAAGAWLLTRAAQGVSASH